MIFSSATDNQARLADLTGYVKRKVIARATRAL